MTDQPSAKALLPQSAPPASPLAEEWAEAWSCSWKGAIEGMSLGQLLDAFAAQAVTASRQPGDDEVEIVGKAVAAEYDSATFDRWEENGSHLSIRTSRELCRRIARSAIAATRSLDTASERAKPDAGDHERAKAALGRFNTRWTAASGWTLAEIYEQCVTDVAIALAEAHRASENAAPPEDPTTEMIERGQRVSIATGRALNDAQIHDIWQAMYDEWQSALTLEAEGR